MQRYEFKVVPAPRRGEKVRGVKTTEERFAHALTGLLNEMGRDGWDYVRADALPCDERVGLTGSKTSFQNMLVFRRTLDAVASAVRLTVTDPVAVGPRLGSAEAAPGPAPALGPANGGAGNGPIGGANNGTIGGTIGGTVGGATIGPKNGLVAGQSAGG